MTAVTLKAVFVLVCTPRVMNGFILTGNIKLVYDMYVSAQLAASYTQQITKFSEEAN